MANAFKYVELSNSLVNLGWLLDDNSTTALPR